MFRLLLVKGGGQNILAYFLNERKEINIDKLTSITMIKRLNAPYSLYATIKNIS